MKKVTAGNSPQSRPRQHGGSNTLRGRLRTPKALTVLGVWTIVLFFSSCAGFHEKPRIHSSPSEQTALHLSELADLASIPQNAEACLHPETADRPLIPPAAAMKWHATFREKHFAPWHREEPTTSAEIAFRGIERFRSEPIFGENMLQRGKEWVDAFRRSTAMESYPNTKRKAIAVTNSSLRLLPTFEPVFYDFDLPGEGYPFDHLQVSTVWGGTPLFLAHTSADGSWVLVETPFAAGWMPIEAIAFVDEAFMRAYETERLAALIQDQVPLSGSDSGFRFMGRLGTVLPLAAEEGDALEIWLPASETDRRAVLIRGKVSRETGGVMPVPITPRNIAALVNQLLGQSYGWGGLYGNRDCSATLKDLFTPFSIWLPRNSPRQAAAGDFIPLHNLDLPDKERLIREKGIPFLTLLWMPGHIMLYLGESSGRPLVFHNTWGIKTKAPQGKEGRHIIGRAVITTLQPGIELPDILLPQGNLLYRIEGMTLIVPDESAD